MIGAAVQRLRPGGASAEPAEVVLRQPFTGAIPSDLLDADEVRAFLADTDVFDSTGEATGYLQDENLVRMGRDDDVYEQVSG